jgi:hypothetical protein
LRASRSARSAGRVPSLASSLPAQIRLLTSCPVSANASREPLRPV